MFVGFLHPVPSIMPLEIQESNYVTEVYLIHATKEPNTINILCVSEQLMLLIWKGVSATVADAPSM